MILLNFDLLGTISDFGITPALCNTINYYESGLRGSPGPPASRPEMGSHILSRSALSDELHGMLGATMIAACLSTV